MFADTITRVIFLGPTITNLLGLLMDKQFVIDGQTIGESNVLRNGVDLGLPTLT